MRKVTAMGILIALYKDARNVGKMHHKPLKLADGSKLSCQDFPGTYSTLGSSVECLMIDSDGKEVAVEEWGESTDCIYGHRTYEMVADLINARGGFADES